jgi:four helix bundle protein
MFGKGRRGLVLIFKEMANFLNYAKGSAGELRTQIYIGMEIGYINHEIGKRWLQEAEEISKMLHG